MFSHQTEQAPEEVAFDNTLSLSLRTALKRPGLPLLLRSFQGFRRLALACPQIWGSHPGISDDAEQKFMNDFVAWTKVMNLDRFNLDPNVRSGRRVLVSR